MDLLQSVLQFMSDHWQSGVAFIAGSITTWIGAFATPFGQQWIARRFARKPVFAISPSRLGSSLKSTVTPLNKLARRKQRLHAKVGDVFIDQFADLNRESKTLEWIADFRTPSVRAAILKSDSCRIQIFFDADLMSEPIELQRPTEASFKEGVQVLRVDSIVELFRSIDSNVKIYTHFSKGIVDRSFPHKSDHAEWNSVHDGKELKIKGVCNLEMDGLGTALISAARYAWVINFEDCSNISIANFVIGHEKSGYCRGGVLRFKNCHDIHIDECDLFGCGTYGLEFDSCRHVEISGTIIRDCSYGILNLKNSDGIVFSECKFENNREFDLFNFSGILGKFMIRDSLFTRNSSNRSIFHFDDDAEVSWDVFVNSCTFENNSYLSFSNRSDCPTQNDTKFVNEKQ